MFRKSVITALLILLSIGSYAQTPTEGWFGNGWFYSGASPMCQSARDFRGQPGALFNGSATFSGYNAKDQFTLVTNAGNAAVPDQSVITVPKSMTDVVSDVLSGRDNVQTTFQQGIIYNTSRIRGFDTKAGINCTFNRKNALEQSTMYSFQGSKPEIDTEGSFAGIGTDRHTGVGFELSKTDKSKCSFLFRPSVSYTDRDRDLTTSSISDKNGRRLHDSKTYESSECSFLIAGAEWEFGVFDLRKEGREIRFDGHADYRQVAENSDEITSVEYSLIDDQSYHRYDDSGRRTSFDATLMYSEPIGKNWAIQGRITACHIGAKAGRDAFDEDNQYCEDLSAHTENNDILLRERILAKYSNKKTSCIFGIQLDEEQNITTNAKGIVGEDDWMFHWSPYASINFEKGYSTFEFNYGGYSTAPSCSDLLPALDAKNPVRLMAGNAGLRPEFSQYARCDYSFFRDKRNTSLDVSLEGSLNTNQMVFASWTDIDGNRYAVPVNTPEFGSDANFRALFSRDFDDDGKFAFTVDGGTGFNAVSNYILEPNTLSLGPAGMNYEAVMYLFSLDDPKGFARSKEGYIENRTETSFFELRGGFKFKFSHLRADISAYARQNLITFSWCHDSDINCRDFDIAARLEYLAEKGWKLETDGRYRFHDGYTLGFGEPELVWNAMVGKEFRTISVRFSISDILNQRKSLTRTAAAEYVRDIRNNVMGRCALIGVCFNLGNAGKEHRERVSRGISEMMF